MFKMKKYLSVVVFSLLLIGCKTQKQPNTINEYGYSQSNPIKVGGVKT